MPSQPILCIGGACIDFKLKCTSQPIPHTSNSAKYTSTYGGVARNIAENLASWTNNISLQCVVGNDSVGRNLLEHLNKLGVDTQRSIVMDNYVTSNYYAILDDKGELFIACNDMELYEHIPFERFTHSWKNWPSPLILFLDTNLPRKLIELALQLARSPYQKICIDPVSVSKSSKLPDNLDTVFLLKPNIDEASFLSGIDIKTPEDALLAGARIRKRGVQNVVISLGAQGYVIINNETSAYIEVPPIDNVIDVNGAGDSFLSGILYGLQQGFHLDECCRIGHRSACLCLTSEATAGHSPMCQV